MVNKRISVAVLSALALIGASAFAQKAPPQLAALKIALPAELKDAAQLRDLDPATPIHITVSLPYADPGGMQRFVDSVSDPKNPNYRHFLTPEQIGQRFGLPAATVNKLADYLKGNGMTVQRIAKNHTAILANCTVGQAETAFHTTIAEFSSPAITLKPGQKLYSYTTSLSVPVTIAPYILDVSGLETFSRPHAQGFVSPSQLRTLYGVAPTYAAKFQGQGRTVAITSFDGFDLSNVPLLYQQFSLPAPAGGVGTNITVEAADPAVAGQNGPQTGEGDLDIQCALSMAPLCNLIVYDGGNLSVSWDPVATLTLEADDNLADVISESYLWHGGAAFYLSLHNQHLAMNAQGITYMACSGDHGAPGVSKNPYPDMDPEVLSVGGTTIHVDTDGNRISETAWNLTNEEGNGTLWGGGGGWFPSSDPFNVTPPYQKGTGVPTNIQYRLIPDISLDADFSYEIFRNDVFQPSLGIAWGGTSCSTPTFAGSLADVEQRLISVNALTKDAAGKQRFGRINDLLYLENGNSKVFFDVTSGNIGALPNGTTAVATVGWDFTSGVGVVNFDGLFNLVANVPTVKTLTISPASLEGGSTTAITGTLTLTGPALTNAFEVNLKSSNSALVVPAKVSMPFGTSTATFSIVSHSVSAPTAVTVTAATTTTTGMTAAVTLTPPHITTVTIAPTSVTGGGTATGTVTIAEPAPSSGIPVTVASSNAAATVPATVTIGSGKTSATFKITTTSVSSSTSLKITATASGKSVTGSLTVLPCAVSSLTLSGSSLYAKAQVTGTVKLTGAAPAAGITVPLTLLNTAWATLSPVSVKVAAGATSGTFTLTAKPVDATNVETVKATLGGVTKSANVTIKPAILSAIKSSVATALGGVQNATVTFTLNAPAGPSGTVVTLKTSPATAAAFTVATIKIPSGSTAISTSLKTVGVAKDTNVTVTAVAGATKTLTVQVTAALLTAFTISPATIQGNGVRLVTGKLTLNGPTGPAARSVALSSTSSSAGSPTSVLIPANAKTVSFTFAPKVVAVNVTITLTAKLGTVALTQTLTDTH